MAGTQKLINEKPTDHGEFEGAHTSCLFRSENRSLAIRVLSEDIPVALREIAESHGRCKGPRPGIPEWYYVLAGEFLFEVGGVKHTLPVGEVSGHQGYSARQGEHEYKRGQGNS